MKLSPLGTETGNKVSLTRERKKSHLGFPVDLRLICLGLRHLCSKAETAGPVLHESTFNSAYGNLHNYLLLNETILDVDKSMEDSDLIFFIKKGARERKKMIYNKSQGGTHSVPISFLIREVAWSLAH